MANMANTTNLVFGVDNSQKLELARKVISGAGRRATSGVATKEQMGMCFMEQVMIPSKNEQLYTEDASRGLTVPTNVVKYDLNDFGKMKAMNPVNWVSPGNQPIEEYLDISSHPIIGMACSIPELVKVEISRDSDTVFMYVTFFMGDNKAIKLVLEPGVALLLLQQNPSLVLRASDLESNRVLGDGRELYILPDERTENVGVLNHNDEVRILNEQSVFDTETGVEWVLVQAKDGITGWMPKAAVSQYSAIFGDPVIDCREFIDLTLSASCRIGDVADYEKQTLAAIVEDLLATQLKKYLTALLKQGVLAK